MIAYCQLPIADCQLSIPEISRVMKPEVFEIGNWQSAIGNVYRGGALIPRRSR